MKRLILLCVLLVALIFPSVAQAGHSPYHSTTINYGPVYINGDSHTWLGGLGTQYPEWDTDACPGRKSTEALNITTNMLRGRHELVVFDIATNDADQPLVMKENLRLLWDVIGPDRKLVLVNSWFPQFGLNRAQSVNNVLANFVTNHPVRSRLVDWATPASQHPEWLSDDGVHFTTTGYQVRTYMITHTVNNFLP